MKDRNELLARQKTLRAELIETRKRIAELQANEADLLMSLNAVETDLFVSPDRWYTSDRIQKCVLCGDNTIHVFASKGVHTVRCHPICSPSGTVSLPKNIARMLLQALEEND